MSEYLADIRSRIEALGLDFQFKGTIKASGNGMERETWLWEYDGSQFVFVAGRKQTTSGRFRKPGRKMIRQKRRN